MSTGLPPTPTDVFTRLTNTLDAARTIVDRIGLRTYRSFLYREFYTGPRRKEGPITGVDWEEITPPPKIGFVSERRIASSGGQYHDGAVEASKISRTRRREELIGKTLYGQDTDDTEEFFWALVPKGQMWAELYNPASDAVLEPLFWRVVLNPANRQVRFVLDET